MIKFSERLKQLMTEFGMKYNTDLARACGWTEGNQSARISNYLAGKRVPDKATADQIAHAFNKSFEELISGTDYKKAILIHDSQGIGQIPLIAWHDIPKVHRNPADIEKLTIKPFDITFRDEEDLYAIQMPLVLNHSSSSSIFALKDYLLINPHRDAEHNLDVIISSTNSKWPLPEYAKYIIELGKPYLELKNNRYIEKSPDIIICGIVVARLNIFI